MSTSGSDTSRRRYEQNSRTFSIGSWFLSIWLIILSLSVIVCWWSRLVSVSVNKQQSSQNQYKWDCFVIQIKSFVHAHSLPFQFLHAKPIIHNCDYCHFIWRYRRCAISIHLLLLLLLLLLLSSPYSLY